MKVITAKVVDGRIEAPPEIADGSRVAILALDAEDDSRPPEGKVPGTADGDAATDGLTESEWRLFRALAKKEALSEISEAEAKVLEELQAKRLRYVDSLSASSPPDPSMKVVEAAYEKVLRALQHYADALQATNPTRAST